MEKISKEKKITASGAAARISALAFWIIALIPLSSLGLSWISAADSAMVLLGVIELWTLAVITFFVFRYGSWSKVFRAFLSPIPEVEQKVEEEQKNESNQ